MPRISARLPTLIALISAGLFGISTPFAKVLIGQMDPWLLAACLYLGSGLGLGFFLLLSYCLARYRRQPATTQPSGSRFGHGEASLQARDLPWLLAVIISGGVIAPVLLMFGLATAPASSVALLLNLEGLLTMLLAWLVFHEGVDRRLLTGALAVLAGAALLAWPVRSGFNAASLSLASALLIGGACLCWAIDNNLTRKLSVADPVQITAIKGLVAGTVNLIIAIAGGASLPPLTSLLAAGIVGFFCYGISLVLFVLSLRHLGAARTGAYFASAPFIGAAAALCFLGEPLTPLFAVAAALMVIGLYLHLTEHHEHEHHHEALFHDHPHSHDLHHQHQHAASDPQIVEGGTHSHPHRHQPLTHRHPHFPDIHHQHGHSS
jgi:drug/metabolite transporter (DMT)-like permease